MEQRIVITGGHLTPALALMNQIRKDRSSWKIFYIGRKCPFEGSKKLSFEYSELTEKKWVNFIPLTTGRLRRQFHFLTLTALLKIPLGIASYLFWLIKIRPKGVVSFGGYLSTPVVISAWFLGIPSLTHEQTLSAGLANKINSLFVKKVAVSFPEVVKQFPAKKTILTGNPINKKLLPPPKMSPLKTFISSASKPILLVTGGKTGSEIINLNLKKSLEKLKKHFSIIHQTGSDKKFLSPYTGTAEYLTINFIKSEYFDWLVSKSQLMVSRSGANLTLRLAVLKKRAVLIPIPGSSGDEQNKNALFLKKLGLAILLPQSKLSPTSLVKAIKKASNLKTNPKYPSWWKEADPYQATEKIWKLTKEVAG